MGLDSEPFLKPTGRANSTRGQPYQWCVHYPWNLTSTFRLGTLLLGSDGTKHKLGPPPHFLKSTKLRSVSLSQRNAGKRLETLQNLANPLSLSLSIKNNPNIDLVTSGVAGLTRVWLSQSGDCSLIRTWSITDFLH